jgi:catechol 2,3-dioxygenase-like lactoylglutathione lyase family enzyme
MIRIHRMTHVGFVTPDIEAAAARFETLFDIVRTIPRPTWLATEEGVHSTMMYVTGAGLEPMQPAREGTPYAAAVAAGRAPFHFSFRVSGIAEVAQHLWDHDLWAQLRPPGKVVSMRRLWLDPLSAQGAHIEFIDREEREVMMGTGREGDAPVVDGPLLQRMTSAIHLVDDLGAARRLYGDVLGFASQGVEELPEEGARRVRFTLGDGAFGGGEGGPALEVVQALDPDAPLGQMRAAMGCGVGPWVFEVADLEAAQARLAELECWMRRRPAGDRLPARLWLHPRSVCGVPMLLTARS